MSLMLVSGLTLPSACSSSAPQQVDAPPATAVTTTPAPPAATPAPKPAEHAKLQAPITSQLRVSATTGDIEATLTVTADRDLRSTMARFSLPAGAQLLSGDLETNLGDLTTGTERAVTIQLRAPATGSHVLSAVVLVQTPSGRTLHKAAAARIGPEPRPETTRVNVFPDGTRVRLAK
jgi:hypothetical protein